MKTRFLIILTIIIGFSSAFIPEFIFGEDLDDEFQNAMKRCTEQSTVFAYGTVIQNSTHYFDDTIDCFIFDNRMIQGPDDISAEKRVYDNLPDFIKHPLKQLKSGIPVDDIQCNDGLIPIQKYDGTPVCVTESTKQKLVERGWTTKDSSTQIIFHDKPLNYWKNLSNDDLRNYNSQLETDDFYYELGNILAEEFFEAQLKQNNIHYTGEIMVRSGISLQPDPPIIGYYGIINATDGNTYMLNTSVNGNVVGKYFELQQLIFDKDVLDSLSDNVTIPFVNKFEKTPTVRIFTEEQDDKMEPHSVIIDFSKTDTVNFVNTSTYDIRIQETGENKIDEIPEDTWHTATVSPGDTISVQFNSTGFYEFNVKKITDRFSNYYEHHGSGEIVVFTENMTDYTFEEGLLMGRVFVQNEPRSEIPWEGIGAGNNRGLEISLVDSVKHAIPDAEEYYLAKIKSLIPFDVNVIVE